MKIQDFLAWLGKKGGSPAEVALRNNMKENAFVKYSTSNAESLTLIAGKFNHTVAARSGSSSCASLSVRLKYKEQFLGIHTSRSL
jgi:hypothetical protein